VRLAAEVETPSSVMTAIIGMGVRMPGDRRVPDLGQTGLMGLSSLVESHTGPAWVGDSAELECSYRPDDYA
jgi:hypothetical protein